MHASPIRIAQHGMVATVTLDRPQVRNAFDERMIAALTDVFCDLGGDPSVRSIILTGSGPVFCAGADLGWMQRMASNGETENRADALRMAQMLQTVYLCPKPVVAKVQGDCHGGGVGLAAACDIVVAAEHAQFSLSEVKFGLIPATISPYVLRALGEQASRRYFLTGERFCAAQAQRLGLVQEVAPAETLDAAVAPLMAALAAAGPEAVAEAKRLVREIAGQPVSDALAADTAGRIARRRASAEGQEGMRAFLEKRAPSWKP